MGKLLVAITLILAAVFTFSIAQAQTTATEVTTINFPVTVNIGGGTPDMTVKLYRAPKGDYTRIQFDRPGETHSVTQMSFDKWDITKVRDDRPEQWVSVDQFVAFVYASGYGAQYKITTTGTGEFRKATVRLPGSAFVCTPVHSAEDADARGRRQGDLPSGARLGDPQPVVAFASTSTTNMAYQSDNFGRSRIIQIWYSFPPFRDDGSAPYNNQVYFPVLTTQPPGLYTGVTVTIDIAPI